jgi:hypothetical protein
MVKGIFENPITKKFIVSLENGQIKEYSKKQHAINFYNKNKKGVNNDNNI